MNSPYSRSPDGGGRQGILANIRVADFGWVGVGACASRLLADFGAEVIKIEDRRRIDLIRRLPIYKGQPAAAFGDGDAQGDINRGGAFNNYNRNKLSLAVNMRDPRGRDIVERLIRVSSVVTENFTPGVMERWGLTYERLNELSPEVIYCRMSGYGHSGPDAHYKSYGPIVQATSGLSFIAGLPGEEPSGWGLSYMDNQAAYFNSAAILAAIYQRNLTGRGTEIDTSAVEVGINLLGPLLLETAVNGRRTREVEYANGTFPPGNRLEHPLAAPHGVYPTSGADRWIAIAVFSDEEWSGLCDVMHSPEWTRNPCFSTLEERCRHQDALDRHIAAWTAERVAETLMHDLQAAGVPAAVVQNAEDLNEFDPQLAARGIFFELDHPVIGPARFEGVPLTFERIARRNWRSAPLLGEDNHYVLHTLLGLEDAEIDELAAAGVV